MALGYLWERKPGLHVRGRILVILEIHKHNPNCLQRQPILMKNVYSDNETEFFNKQI